MSKKRCVKCSITKPEESFPKNYKLGYGTAGVCRDCKNAWAQLNRKSRAGQRRKYNPEPRLKYIGNNPEKRSAHTYTNNAVRDGRLARGVCEVCGHNRVEAHHNDYTKPLEVRWLCTKHHRALHRKPLRVNPYV